MTDHDDWGGEPTNDTNMLRRMVEDHADSEDFTYETLKSSAGEVVFKNLISGKVYRLTCESVTDQTAVKNAP